MADGVELDAGSGGAIVATDDAGAAGHVQIIKLAIAADGSATLIPADATDGLLVKLAAQAGVDLMDVTVNNGTGASSVPTQGGAAHDAAAAGNPLLVGFEAKDFDGAALPNAVSAEADAVRAAASLSGVQYVMVVSEDGSVVGTVTAAQATAANLNMTEASGAGIKTDTAAIAASASVLDDWDNGASDGASVSGDVAHDAADAGEPVKAGHKAIDIGANPTDVAANDRSNSYGLRNGVPLMLGGAPNIVTKHLQITDADGAQTDTAVVTVAANVAIVVTRFSAMCDGANTGDVGYRCGFGTANTPAVDAAGMVSAHPGVKSGSGVVEGNGGGIIGMGASNEDLRLTCEDPAGGAIDFTVSYFTLAIG